MTFSLCRESAAAAAAKSLQSCPTLCDPIDGSLPGSAVPKSVGSLKPRFQSMIGVLPPIGSVGYKLHPFFKKKKKLFFLAVLGFPCCT